MPDASVEVRCPENASDSFISELLESKKSWIEEHTAQKRLQLELRKAFTVSPGTALYFLGKPLIVRTSYVHHIDYDSFYISGTDLRQSAVKLYYKYAKSIITQKVRHFSEVMDAHPVSVNINSAKTRWGSCGVKNTLNFSWKLIIADERAVDYVVVHELAHTFEHNHSARFWDIVERYIPDYKDRQPLLDKAQKIISIQGW